MQTKEFGRFDISYSARPQNISMAEPFYMYDSGEENWTFMSDEKLEEYQMEELEFERDKSHADVLIAIQVIIMCLILAGNSMVIVLIVKNKELRNPTNLYIASLCVADISVAVLPVPLNVLTSFSSYGVTSGLCKSLEYFNFFATASNAYCVVVIAIDRHRAVVHPFYPKIKPRGCFRRIAAVWALGAVYAIRAPLTFDVTKIHHQENSQNQIYRVCLTTTPDLTTRKMLIVLDSVAMCLLPFLMVIGLYFHILYKLFNKHRKIALALGLHINAQLEKRNKYILKMVLAIMAVSILCEVPVYIWEIYVFVGEGSFPGFLALYDIFKLLSYSNSWLNVLVYVCFNDSFRGALKSQSCCCSSTQRVYPFSEPPGRESTAGAQNQSWQLCSV